jgi:hypothetical protein
MVKQIEMFKPKKIEKGFEQLRDTSKYFILHYEGQRFHLMNLTIGFKREFNAKYEIMNDTIHSLYNPFDTTNKRYKKSKGEEIVLNEVHLFSNSMVIRNDSMVVIPVESIIRIDINKHDAFRTISSYAWPLYPASLLGLMLLFNPIHYGFDIPIM